MSYRDHPKRQDKNGNGNPDGTKPEASQNYNQNQLISKVSNASNYIHGNNGERYHLPINAANLSALESFCKWIFGTNDFPYKIYRPRDIERVAILKMARHIKMLPAYARIYSPRLSFPPDFDLFFKIYRQHPISQYSHIDWEGEEFSVKNLINAIEPEHAELANRFVLSLREMAKKERLKSRMSDWLSGCKRNKKYLQNFMTDMLEEHSQIVVVDLVLLYRKTACKDDKEASKRGLEQRQLAEREYQSYMQYVDSQEMPNRWIGLEEVKNDLAHFFNNMRNKRTLFSKDKFIDYFGRIEYSREAGHHVHICFFYKGSKVREDISYSHLIGKYWGKITEGRGYYFSCNMKAAAGAYKNVGIGTVEHDDFEKIRHLWTAVSYFVKASQIVRVKSTGKEQMVLHGKRKKRQGTKLGRPRGEGLSGPEYRAKLEQIFL